MRWGLFDTVDKLWLGDDTGPKVYDTEEIINDRAVGEHAKIFARVAAQITEVRAGWPHGRIEVRELDCPNPKVRDAIPLTDTTLNVLRKIEKGVIV